MSKIEDLERRIKELEQEAFEYKCVEKALRDSRKRLEEAEHIAHLGHWELNLVSNKLIWSDEIYRIFDLQPQEFGASYEAFLDAVHPDDREFVNKAYTESLKNKKNYDIVHRLLLKDGTVKYVNEKCQTEYDNNGNPFRSLGTVLDITERKHTEEEREQNILKLKRILEETVDALASALEKRDQYTSGHQQRVSQLASAIGQEMNLPEEQIEGIRIAGILHDIGKIYVPAEILSKPNLDNDIESLYLRTHPKVGYEILNQIEFDWPIAQAILQHHEKLNGTGYPAGISGEDMILESKILSVADVVEAMSSHRPYRPAKEMNKVMEEISQNKGILYDSDVVDACLRLFTEKGYKLE